MTRKRAMTRRRTPAIGASGPENPAVGYGNPPVHSRFKKGRSGNPKGRQPGARSLRADLEAELKVEVPVSENGKTTVLRKQLLAVKTLVNKAAKGDARALSLLFELIGRMRIGEDESRSAVALPAQDEAILKNFLERKSVPSTRSDDG